MSEKRSVLFVNTFEPVVPIYRDFAATWPGRKEALVSQGGYRAQEDDLGQHISVRRLWVPRWLRNNRRACALLYWLFAPWVILGYRDTNIVFLSQPPLFYVIGAIFARARPGNRVILHVMDLYPDLLGAGGVLRSDSLAYRLLQRLAANAMRRADSIIVIGRCMRDRVIALGADRDRVRIVPNWAHPSRAALSGPDEVRYEHHLSGKFVVMYSGNLGNFHQFDTILEVAKRFEVTESVRFVFAGQGTRHREVHDAIKSGQENILLLPSQGLSVLASFLRAADVHFVSLRSGMEGLMVPSKFYGILAAGRPVIYEGDESGEVARVIRETHCGRVVAPGAVRELEQAIRSYVDAPELVRMEGDKALSVYESMFHRDKVVPSYVSILSESD